MSQRATTVTVLPTARHSLPLRPAELQELQRRCRGVCRKRICFVPIEVQRAPRSIPEATVPGSAAPELATAAKTQLRVRGNPCNDS